MSLLFVVCMKYLTRSLRMVGINPLFKYHPKCTSVKLNHLFFAYDVILCSKGGFRSVYMLLHGFNHFSNVSRIEVNESKSELYTTGMKREENKRHINMSGFKVGQMIFRYFGVPISHTKIISHGLYDAGRENEC